METKFEYQVSAEQAENIAIEQFVLILRMRGIKLIYFPILLAIVFSLIGASAWGTLKIGGGDYLLIGRIIGGVLGFAFGLGTGFLTWPSLQRKLRAGARTTHNRMGSMRTLSWNAEAVHFKSAYLESKVGWQMIDKIEVGEVGVYGILNKSRFFAIPKAAFPPGTTPDDLIKAWQNGVRQPPIMASASIQ